MKQDETWVKRSPRSRKGGVTGGPNARRRSKARRIPETRRISKVMRRFRERKRPGNRRRPK